MLNCIRSVLFSVACLAFAGQAVAAPPPGYPDRPLRLITPYAAGGGTDYFSRLIAPRMAEVLGQPVIVENRPGAAGAIAAVAVTNGSPADGYTILLGDRGMYALNPALFDKLQYDPQKDLVPVTLIANYDFVLVVNPQVLPVKSVADVIAAAKAAPTGLNYGSPGNSTTHRMAMEMFARDADVNLVPIPYKGGAPALQDLLAGQIGMMFLDRVSATPLIESGKLRAIAAAGRTRIAAYPNLPTVAESGLKGFNADAWLGLTMRKGTPDSIVQAVRDAYVKAIADPEFRSKLVAIGIKPYSSTSEEFRRHIEAETELWGRIIRERGIKPD